MRLVPYWSRAHLGDVAAFGWSAESQQAAHANALERARRTVEWLERGGDIQRTWEYYDARPPREPIVQTFGDAAAITRCAYGAHVLNTARVAFVDVDRPPEPRQPGLLGRLLGRRPPPPPQPVPDRVAEVARRHPDLSLRLYQTRAGYRVAVTDRLLEPGGPEARALFDELGADPLYVQLCRAQECFRARLSPKPWRVGLPAPQTNFYPWDDDPARRQRFETWDAEYETACVGWSVCEQLARFGPGDVHPEVEPLLDLHDRRCCTGSPLA